MSRNKTTGSTGGGESGYAVGYGKPPTHGKFRPGHSGNPAGRPKGVRNLMSDLWRMLKMPVRLKIGGRLRKRSTQEAALMVLREKALGGDARALFYLLEIALRWGNEEGRTEPGQLRAAEDQAILAAYLAEFAAGAKNPAAALSPNHPTSDPGVNPSKDAPK